MRFFVAALLAVSLLDCKSATPAPNPNYPCQGSAFAIDSPDERCLVPFDDTLPMEVDALAIRATSALQLKSGNTEVFTLELENISDRPIDVPLPDGCTIWFAVASNAQNSSFTSECGGLCGRNPTMLRVTLDPGGKLTKKLTFSAEKTVIQGDTCAETKTPLPAGEYTLEIELPWRNNKFKLPLLVE